MIFFRRVSGQSMMPSLVPGQLIICSTTISKKLGSVVLIRRGQHEVIKRIVKIQDDRVWVEGDNVTQSTDSRDFGWVNKSDILGSMKYKLPIATEPPKVRISRAPALGWITAAIMIVFALVHLFRIDTFVPELAHVFDGDIDTAKWVASAIVSMEIFALPFLMRMRLSPLAHYVSGALAVVVPLVWLLISLWTYGTFISTAQLGEFVALPSSILLIFSNLMWLIFSYYSIWALGYDRRANEKQSVATRWLARLSK